MADYVKDRLVNYEVTMAQLFKQLTLRIQRELKTFQTDIETRLLNKINAESSKRGAQENMRLQNT
jgi:hypothetical protein